EKAIAARGNGLFFIPRTIRLLRVLRLVASRARTIAPVALVGEAAVAGAPVRIRGLEAGRTGTLAAVAVVGHAGVLGSGDRCGAGLSDDRDTSKQSQAKG